MGDAAGETADGFHLLRLAKLLFQSTAFGNILGEELEEDGVAVVTDSASRETNDDGAAVLPHPLGDQAMKVCRERK